MIVDKDTSLFFRPEMKEDFIIKEVQREYKKVDFNNRVVLDAGSHIGASIYMALKNGAVFIHAYEPTPTTFDILKKNFGSNDKVKLYNIALTGNNEKTLDFYIHNKYSASNSLTKSRNRAEKISVECLNFWDEVNRIKPDILKIDIEGAEFDFMIDCDIPDFIKEVAIELHTTTKKRKEDAKKILNNFKEWYLHKAISLNWYATVAILKRIPNKKNIKVLHSL